MPFLDLGEGDSKYNGAGMPKWLRPRRTSSLGLTQHGPASGHEGFGTSGI